MGRDTAHTSMYFTSIFSRKLVMVVAYCRSFQLWKANRKSMEQFFIENLSSNENFYIAAQARLGDYIKIVV
jgi:hypothetical protein